MNLGWECGEINKIQPLKNIFIVSHALKAVLFQIHLRKECICVAQWK